MALILRINGARIGAMSAEMDAQRRESDRRGGHPADLRPSQRIGGPRVPITIREPRINSAAVALTLGLVLALGVRLWATGRLDETIGPLNLAVQGDRVLVHTPDWLFELTAEGAIQRTIAFTDLGFSGTVTDMQLLEDGRLLLGDFEAKCVQRCDIQARRCESIGPSDRATLQGTFKFFWHAPTRRLFLTDTARHRLLVQEGERGPIRELSAPGMLKYPNSLMLAADGFVYVADTNHHRVVRLDVSGATPVERGPAISAYHPRGRAGHTWPIRIARDGVSRWWLLNGNGFLQNHDLVSYTPEGAPLLRVALPSDAEPFALAATPSWILVTDSERVTLEAIDPERGAITEFGSGPFQDWLRGVRDLRRRLQILSRAALWAVFLLAAAVAGTGAYALRDRSVVGLTGHPTPALTSLPGDPLGDVRWLAPDPKLVSGVRVCAYLASVLALAVPGGLAVAWSQAPCLREAVRAGELTVPGILVGLLTILIPLLAALTLRALRTRVGGSGALLCFADYAGRVVASSPTDVFYTRRAMSCGTMTAFLTAGWQRTVFPKAAFDQEIRPLLDRAKRVGGVNLLLYQVMQRQPLALTQVAIALVVVALGLVLASFG